LPATRQQLTKWLTAWLTIWLSVRNGPLDSYGTLFQYNTVSKYLICI